MRKRKITCKQCGYTWEPRVIEPERCPNPNCRSRRYMKRG
jgi:predicted Zn-ribbon and HTH transcriptional regulator